MFVTVWSGGILQCRLWQSWPLLFYPVLEFVVSDFLSNKALLLPDLYKKFEDLVDKTALIKSLKESEDKIGEPSPIRGNKFSQLSLEDFKETGDESFAWESFEKKLSAYSFLKYLVQENDIHVDLPGLNTFLSFSETDTEKSELFNWSFRWDSRFKSHSFENRIFFTKSFRLG